MKVLSIILIIILIMYIGYACLLVSGRADDYTERYWEEKGGEDSMTISDYLEDGADYIIDDCDYDCDHCEIREECEDAR